MNLYKLKLNYSLHFLLLAAFCTMQLATAHIHLAEQHQHGGAHHQHQIATHAHSLVNPAAINISHQSAHVNIIEFDYKYSSSKTGTLKAPVTTIIGTNHSLILSCLIAGIKIPAITNTKLSYCDRSTLNPRAPPQIA